MRSVLLALLIGVSFSTADAGLCHQVYRNAATGELAPPKGHKGKSGYGMRVGDWKLVRQLRHSIFTTIPYFSSSVAPTPTPHRTTYPRSGPCLLIGALAIRSGGHFTGPIQVVPHCSSPDVVPSSLDQIEMYHLPTDPFEATNLNATSNAKVRERGAMLFFGFFFGTKNCIAQFKVPCTLPHKHTRVHAGAYARAV